MKIVSLKEAKNIKEKVIGLIGRKKPHNIMIKTHFGIHTFGLKFPIDVLIINNQNQAVKIKRSLKANSIFLWNPRYSKVLELTDGFIDRNKIKLKDQILIKFI